MRSYLHTTIFRDSTIGILLHDTAERQHTATMRSRRWGGGGGNASSVWEGGQANKGANIYGMSIELWAVAGLGQRYPLIHTTE